MNSREVTIEELQQREQAAFEAHACDRCFSDIRISVITQENDRYAAQAKGEMFVEVGYGASEQQAVANALEAYARDIREWEYRPLRHRDDE